MRGRWHMCYGGELSIIITDNREETSKKREYRNGIKGRRPDWDDEWYAEWCECMVNDDGCYNSSASIHRVHDISPILLASVPGLPRLRRVYAV